MPLLLVIRPFIRLTVIFSSILKDELLKITGDEGGRTIIKKRYDEVKFVSFEHSLVGKDIDTWDEYMKWR